MFEPATAWQPYEPTPDDPWDLPKVAHLHRRAGFGANWSELQRDLAAGPAESIGRLLEPPAEDAAFAQVSQAMWRAAGGDDDADTYSDGDDVARRGAEWWLYRMALGGDLLGEKLTLLWHNHFATALRGVYSMPLMLRQNATLREHARGPFGRLLAAVEADPAMLLWLNGGRNEKEHPNENFARELLELFTLGTDNYTEADVRTAARGLTGWQATRNGLLQRTKVFTYRDNLGDASPKTFLGETGPWQRDDILRIVLKQPAATMHLCRRLYRWFIDESAEPDDALISPLAAEYRASNYSTDHVVGIMLRSRIFFSAAAYRRRVKSPVEYCVGVLRQLEPQRSPNMFRLAARSCQRQGQSLFNPPSVNGWEGGQAWLNSNTLLMRMNWTAEMLVGNAKASLPPFDAEATFKAQQGSGNAADAIEHWSRLLLDGRVDNATRQQALGLLEQGGADNARAAVHVFVQSPTYHLA